MESLVAPVLGFLGVVIVAAIGAYATIKTSTKEKVVVADKSIDKTLESPESLAIMKDRLVLRDEQIEFLEAQRDEALRQRNEAWAERDQAIAERDRALLATYELRAEERERLNERNS